MDPALEYALRRGPPDRELEVAALIAEGATPPSGLRVVSIFDDVVTGRVRLDKVVEVRADRAIRSLKLTRLVRPADAILGGSGGGGDSGRPPSCAATGAGVVLAFLDWGCDFAHPNFRRPDGRTRLRALWDQRGPSDGNRWG